MKQPHATALVGLSSPSPCTRHSSPSHAPSWPTLACFVPLTKLTEVEYRELSYKKEIYELVKKRSEEDDNIGEYKMPEAYDQKGVVDQEKRFSAAIQHYRDPTAGDKMNPFAEQEAWEEHQIGKVTLKFGSKK